MIFTCVYDHGCSDTLLKTHRLNWLCLKFLLLEEATMFCRTTVTAGVASCWRIAEVLSDWFSPVWSIWNVYSMGLLVRLLSETQGRYDACQNTCTYFFCNLIHWWGLCIDAYHGWADVSLLHKSDFIMFSTPPQTGTCQWLEPNWCWHSEAKTMSTFEKFQKYLNER